MDGSDIDTPAAQPDDATGAGSHDAFPVIGIGASAGGLTALQELFAHAPADTGMAFVVIVHLSPEYDSYLASLLQHHIAMPVTQVTEAVHVEPNHIYVIPPARQLAMNDGTIQLIVQEESRGARAPIDMFFRTLAVTHTSFAGAVVLSGAGADGAIGLPRVKECGGVTIVQDPGEAQFDGMPRNAIATGLVDYVLPAAEIVHALVSYWRNGQAIQLPAPEAQRPDDSGEAMRGILNLLRARTGHDFSQYKRATVLRRVGRRMQVNSAADLPAYLMILRGRANEVQALLRDLLISVTNFFRDPEVWAAFSALIPQLFEGKGPGDQVRVWVAGCATGEEAYSVAMMLYEYALTLADVPPAIQVFATDIDEDAIAQARQGLYPATIAADVSAERLERFFIQQQQHYRIRDEVRDLVLFAAHNLLRDPPFSRLDMITCRNVLIYLNREMQEQVLQLFHFTLLANGALLLGASETTDSVPNMFMPIDKIQRLFRRRTVLPAIPAVVPNMPLVGMPRARMTQEHSAADGNVRSLAELNMQLLAQYAPPTVIVNESYDIVHLARGAGRFLLRADGEPSINLLREIHAALRLDLRTALLQAAQHHQQVTLSRVRMDIDGTPRLVNIVVQPITEPDWARGHLLVIFNDLADASAIMDSHVSDAEPLVRQLEADLQRTREQLRTTSEQYETAVEEYKAANEELQAINEELRAATEELETSKEELQSINEELTTVNQELKHKIEEVSQVNNDLQNLIASTSIGTVFVDRAIRIKRYTPSAQVIFNLIPSDINRPLAHVTHKLEYDRFSQNAQQVLTSLVPIEQEVHSSEGRWYLARLQPYRTQVDRIDGVVLTFVDITQRKQAEEDLRQSEARFRTIINQTIGGIAETDLTGRFTLVNDRYSAITGYTRQELLGMRLEDVTYAEDWARHQALFERIASEGTGFEIENRNLRKNGELIWTHNSVSAIRDAHDQPQAITVISIDVTNRVQAAQAVVQARDQLETKVSERTALLAEANTALQLEVQQRAALEVERQEVLRKLVTAQEEERHHISRELHDQMGQSLSALQLGIASLISASPPPLADTVVRLQAIATQIDQDIDRLALELRPVVLDDLGLIAVMQQHIAEWSDAHHISADFQLLGQEDGRLASDLEIVLYRAMQESLNNVLKHAAAQHVGVVLELRADVVTLIIEDDGRGFDADARSTSADHHQHLGLLGMRERVAMVGGTLTIESEPGSGTTLFVRVPLVVV